MNDTKSNLLRVTALVALMNRHAARAEELKREMDIELEAYYRIEREDLPELMRETGLEKFTLRDGTEVSVYEDVSASISEERRAEAHAWLREHNFGGLIKTIVAVAFGRGEESDARRLAERIRDEEHHNAQLNETVHPQTLKAFVREQLGAGRAVPMDLFGVHPFSRARVKTPREAKAA